MPGEEHYRAMKVKELRKLLAGRGLAKSGRKDDLVARLVEADAAGGSVADDAPAGAASGDGKGSKTGGSASVADSAPMDTSASVVNESKKAKKKGKKQNVTGQAKARLKNRRKRKANRKRRKRALVVQTERLEDGMTAESGVEVEYITADPDIDLDDPRFAEFGEIFEKFKTMGLKTDDDEEGEGGEGGEGEGGEAGADGEAVKLSKTQRKKLMRLSVAELKQLVDRPDLVELHDVTSAYPRLVIHIKSTRNTVPVPDHWAWKRKYLINKVGKDKIPYKLPEFIENTGIGKIRAAVAEKEAEMSLKQKQRARLRPTLGIMDIDYQTLHDAFFKYQTKPPLTIHGDAYFENKELGLTKQKHRPGHLSEKLREALGMPEGAPPPWLIAQQRYGPPPAYPYLSIPGLNAPIPEGAAFGFHAGGWGKPPVDERGVPLYGDVFGVDRSSAPDAKAPVQRAPWGKIADHYESSSEEYSSDDEGSEGSDAGASDASGDGFATGTATMGTQSVMAGFDTDGTSIDLRKSVAGTDEYRPTVEAVAVAAPEAATGGRDPNENRQLYQVLEQQDASIGSAFMGSSHKYVIPASGAAPAAPTGERVHTRTRARKEKVAVALSAEDLEDLDDDTLRDKFAEQIAEKRSQESRNRIRAGGVGDGEGSDSDDERRRRKRLADDDDDDEPSKRFKF